MRMYRAKVRNPTATSFSSGLLFSLQRNIMQMFLLCIVPLFFREREKAADDENVNIDPDIFHPIARWSKEAFLWLQPFLLS